MAKRIRPSSEVWRNIVGFPDYEVSNHGRVRRATWERNRQGIMSSLYPGKILKPWTNRGYIWISLSNNGEETHRAVHQLVCEAFHGPRPSLRHDATHWDGDRANNIYTNLRWATRKENINDGIRLERTTRGTKSPASKLTNDQVLTIRKLHSTGGYTQIELANTFGVSRRHIGKIVNKERWHWLE